MADSRWLEVSLTTSNELAEAVAEVMSRFVSNGVVVESGVHYNDADDVGTLDGWARVYGYMVIDETLEERRLHLEEALWFLGRIQELPEPSFRIIEDEDWMVAWKKHYKPIPIGERLMILPAWYDEEDPTRIAVKIDPSMAFGTGTHPSTQLCMEAVEKYTPKGGNVIDVGCGSGILSIGAIKMGAIHALGVDIDPASVRSTKENAAINGIKGEIEVGLGSVEEILNGQFSIREARLVLANILAPVLISLFKDGLADLITPGGRIILAGILEEQSERVGAAALEKGLKFEKSFQKQDWVALVYSK